MNENSLEQITFSHIFICEFSYAHNSERLFVKEIRVDCRIGRVKEIFRSSAIFSRLNTPTMSFALRSFGNIYFTRGVQMLSDASWGKICGRKFSRYFRQGSVDNFFETSILWRKYFKVTYGLFDLWPIVRLPWNMKEKPPLPEIIYNPPFPHASPIHTTTQQISSSSPNFCWMQKGRRRACGGVSKVLLLRKCFLEW